MNESPSAIAFDVFGTLCYGNAASGPYEQVRQTFGLPAKEFRHAALTLNIPLVDLVARFRGMDKISDLDREMIAFAEREVASDCKEIKLFGDAVVTLRSLQAANIPYGLISNLAAPYAQPVVELLKKEGLLPSPELILWSFQEGIAKPTLKIYTRFCERANKEPGQVLVVGDKEINDVRAPREVGFQSLHLVRGDRAVVSNGAIHTLEQVPRLLGLTIPKIDLPENRDVAVSLPKEIVVGTKR